MNRNFQIYIFPNFTLLLLTHNWEQHSFQIEFEVIDDIKCKVIDDDLLNELDKRLFFTA